jgi:uncharacterized membrane protein
VNVQRALAAALTAGALLWSAALLLAPFALTSHNVPLATAAAYLYQAAGLVCHQRPERSFHYALVQQPVCARCIGLYLSAGAGAVLAWLMAGRGHSAASTRLLFGLAAVPTAVTVAIEFTGLAHPSNIVRALSAIPLGAAGAWVFVASLRSEADAKVEPPASNRL